MSAALQVRNWVASANWPVRGFDHFSWGRISMQTGGYRTGPSRGAQVCFFGPIVQKRTVAFRPVPVGRSRLCTALCTGIRYSIFGTIKSSAFLALFSAQHLIDDER